MWNIPLDFNGKKFLYILFTKVDSQWLLFVY